jgi:hypothetical protein
MANIQDKQAIRAKTEELKVIYKDYLAKIKALQEEQNAIIGDFIKELEQRKIDEIKRKI